MGMIFYKDFAPSGAGRISFRWPSQPGFCASHVKSPTLKFLFEDTSDAALVRWKS